MEAIIRKARKYNPNVDIVMTYFVNPEILNDYQRGIDGRLVDPINCTFDKKWSYAIPEWTKLAGTKRDRFKNIEMLSTEKIGAELTFEFSGTAVGAYIVAGPDAGIVEVSIDNGEFREFNLFHHKFSINLHYPRTVMFSNDLEKGKHSMKLRMLKKTSSKGNAARIMNFVVN